MFVRLIWNSLFNAFTWVCKSSKKCPRFFENFFSTFFGAWHGLPWASKPNIWTYIMYPSKTHNINIYYNDLLWPGSFGIWYIKSMYFTEISCSCYLYETLVASVDATWKHKLCWFVVHRKLGPLVNKEQLIHSLSNNNKHRRKLADVICIIK